MGVVTNLVFGIGSVTVAGIVAVVVGRRRGIDQVEDRADGEIKKLVDAQAARLAILENENRRLTIEVASLTQTVATLRAELDVEKKITARIRSADQ